MALKLITPPDGYPVTLEEIKDHCNATEFTDDDAKLERYLAEETANLDGWWGHLNKALKPQTWQLSLDEFPAGPIQLPLGPTIEVLSVVYDDEDGNEQTVPPGDYVVDLVTDNGWIAPVADTDWPATIERVNAVRVLYIAGYPDVEDNSSGAPSGATISSVPDYIKAAIKLRVASRYAGREDYSEPKDSASERLLRGRTPLIIA